MAHCPSEPHVIWRVGETRACQAPRCAT